MSAQVSPTYRELPSGTSQAMLLAKKAGTYLLLVLASVLVLFPLLFAFSLAVQGETMAPTLIPDLSKLDVSVFAQAFAKEKHLGGWILNSFVVSVAVTLGQLLTSVLAAYALSHLRFPAKPGFFFVFLGTLMIPWESTIIPNYLAITSWGWKDTYQGLIVPFLASGFGIFLLRQSFLTIPHELYEAAVIDGCGRTRYLWSIDLKK